MIRALTDAVIPDETLLPLLDLARRAPSAGFTQGTHFLALRGPEETSQFWDMTLPSEERASFRWPGLLRAHVIVLPLADARAYLDRYSEPDKAPAGLGESFDEWPVPYWHIDTAMAAQNLLLLATEASLGALFFGIFRRERELLRSLDVPDDVRAIGAIALGVPEPGALHPAAPKEGSPTRRTRRAAAEVIHLGRFGNVAPPA
jgi:nitroreductase